jgi:hypothetical protein
MTKRIVLTVLFFVVSFGLLQAQMNQGNFMLGASSSLSLLSANSDIMGLGISTYKYKSDRSGFEEPDADRIISFNLSPKAGYLIADNIAVGIDLNVAVSTSKEGSSDDKFSTNMLAAGPFVRYYIPASTVFPFVEAGASFGRINMKYDGGFFDGEKTKTNLLSFGGGAGIAAPLGESAMLDVMAVYNSVTTKDADNNDDNDRIVYANIGLRLGFTVFIGGN